MEKYYAESVELSDLAEAAFMSRFHYVRIFKQMYGVTPRNYFKDMRISKASQKQSGISFWSMRSLPCIYSITAKVHASD